MAMQIIEKEYPIDTASATAGYDEIAADLTSWYYWDEVDTETENTTIFKKFQPGSETAWCGLKLTKSTGAYGATIQAVTQSASEYSYHAAGGSSGNQIRYIACAVSENGFVCMASNTAFPASANNTFQTFGMHASTNKATGTSGFCSFACRNNAIFIGGASTVSSSQSSQINTAVSSSGLIAADPLISAYSADIPEDLLRLSLIPDGSFACNMQVTYEGKTYRRLGCILMPE